MTKVLLQRTAQTVALVVLAAAGAGVVTLTAVVIIGGVALGGAPLVLGLLGAASWPLVRECLREAGAQLPTTHLGLPGWAWLSAAGVLVGGAIA